MCNACQSGASNSDLVSVSVEDFHLASATVVEIGNGVALDTFNDDKDGHSRPGDELWDIGAYEYVAGVVLNSGNHSGSMADNAVPTFALEWADTRRGAKMEHERSHIRSRSPQSSPIAAANVAVIAKRKESSPLHEAGGEAPSDRAKLKMGPPYWLDVSRSPPK